MSDMSSGYRAMLDAFARGVQPDPDLPVDEWSDEFMVIPKDSGSNEYGRYRSDRTPHARAVMQCLSPRHPCKRVVAMVASQMFKTQVALNFLCCTVHQQPANFLWLMPTGGLVKRISKRIDKTIAAVAPVAERVADPRSRDAANNQNTKEYQGGTLFLATAGSAANLAEVPARYLVYDEIDRSETNVDQEGSPSAMAEARQTTFAHNRKAYYPSSPTIDGESNIQALYLQGTQREALAECLHCGRLQPLVLERLIRSEDGRRALYPCAECGALHEESDKPRMFAKGAWSEGVPGDSETESFTASQMFLPYGWTSWLALMVIYDAAKAELDQGNDAPMIAFYNTRLARVWKKDAETVSHSALMDRREAWKLRSVQAGACVLTAAIDTQADRLEFKVVGWGEGMESWIVDYQVIPGSPDDESTWNTADMMLKGRYRHEHGQMLGIAAAFVDSGGTATQEVYNFTRARRHRQVYPVKGASRPNRPILASKPSNVDFNWRGISEKGGVRLWLIGTDTAKDYLAARWKKAAGPGAVHFPADLTEDYFKQLTAEYRTGGYKRGHRTTWWEKKKGDRNEALDLMVYNVGAAHFLGLHKYTASHWQTLRERLNPNTGDLFGQPDAAEAGEASAPSAAQVAERAAAALAAERAGRQMPNAARAPRGGFMNRWRK